MSIIIKCLPLPILPVWNFDHWELDGQAQPKGMNPITALPSVSHAVAVYGGGTQAATLTVRASDGTNPINGVPVSLVPTDKNGAGDGTTPFTRIYQVGNRITLLLLNLDSQCSITIGGVRYAFSNWKADQDASIAATRGPCRNVIDLDITGPNPMVTALFERRGLPDLIPTGLQTQVISVQKEPRCEVNCKLIFTVAIVSVGVQNIGSGTAGPSQVSVIGTGLFALLPVPTLEPRQSYNVPLNRSVRKEGGQVATFVSTVKVDSGNQVQESDENNNTRTFIITCMALGFFTSCTGG